MILDQCPHCGAQHVQMNGEWKGPLHPSSNVPSWQVVRCQNPKCQLLVLAVVKGDTVQHIHPAGTYELPPAVSIPDEIRDDYREAGRCLGAGANKASMVMSRRVLQRCLKEQGCEQAKLAAAIKHAVDTGILRKPLHDLANEIREYGNLGAHPDDDQLANATRENAEQILAFAQLLIHEFYELPDQATKLRKGREQVETAT